METYPRARIDLEFFPGREDGQDFILVRDHLGLSPEGTALSIPLYQFMALLDGTRSVRDLQTIFMRQQGGVFVGSETILGLLKNLDDTYLLDSEAFRSAKHQIISEFTRKRVRPSCHSGKSYPENPKELENRLAEIMAEMNPGSIGETVAPSEIRALVAPHIDLGVGHAGYAKSYGTLRGAAFTRVVVLGTGHQLQDGIFSLTDKDFETPLGIVQGDREAFKSLKNAGLGIVAPDDFIHRSEHSIEFQLIFLQHVLKQKFTIVPILCGSLQLLPAYNRQAFLERTGPFLETLRRVLEDPAAPTLLVAGVDFSHTGPKFGHEQTARAMESLSREHDQNLLKSLCDLNAADFWKESERVQDRFHVCGFSALACFLEVLPHCRGTLLGYELWHEAPTQSAVGFASAVFAGP